MNQYVFELDVSVHYPKCMKSLECLQDFPKDVFDLYLCPFASHEPLEKIVIVQVLHHHDDVSKVFESFNQFDNAFVTFLLRECLKYLNLLLHVFQGFWPQVFLLYVLDGNRFHFNWGSLRLSTNKWVSSAR